MYIWIKLKNLSRGNEIIRPHRDLYMNVHCSFIYNHQQLETTQMPINWWMNNLNVYIQKAGYHLTMKINEIMTQATTWMNSDNMLCERNSYRRPHIAQFHFYVQNREFHRDKRGSVVARDWGDWRMTGKGYRFAAWGNENVLKFTVVIV